MFRDFACSETWQGEHTRGLLTSNDDCPIFSNRVASTEGVGGEVKGGESLAGNVIDRTNLSLAVAELQHVHSLVSKNRTKEKTYKIKKKRLCLSASI